MLVALDAGDFLGYVLGVHIVEKCQITGVTIYVCIEIINNRDISDTMFWEIPFHIITKVNVIST